MKYIVDITKPPFPQPKKIMRTGILPNTSCETYESIVQREIWNLYIKEYKRQIGEYRKSMT